jgi:ABC-type glycerol-3-phosphate transport system substrate-binding protein
MDNNNKSSMHRLNRRKVIKSVGAGSLVAIAGCAGSDSESQDSQAESVDASDIPESVDLADWEDADINWTAYEGEELVLGLLRHPVFDVLQPLLPAFRQLTGMDLNIIQYPEQEYRQKRLTDLSTGAGIFDAIMLGQPLMQYWDSGWIEPLDQYMTDDSELYDAEWYNMDDVVQGARSIARGRDQLDNPIALPATTEATLVFYRKDLYEEQNLDVPTTFEEYQENIKIIDENYDIPGVVARGLRGYGMNLYPFSGVLRSFGGSHWDEFPTDSALDNDTAIEAADYYSSLLQEYGPGTPSNLGWPDCINQMSQGNAGHWGPDTSYFYETLSDPETSEVPDQIGMAPHPKGSGGTQPNTFAWLMAASSESSRPGAAFLFMLFTTSEPAQRYLAAEQDFPPVRNSLYAELDGEEYVDTVVPMMEKATPSSWDPTFPKWGEKVSVELQNIISEQKTPEEGMNSAAESMEQVIENN